MAHADLKTRRAYKAWHAMLRRCLDQQHKSWPNYGGRGIAVCARWADFGAFLSDMGAPDAGLSIDRINNDGDYEPGNCRWATPTEQQSNTRRARRITYLGETHCVGEWARRLGIRREVISNRLRRGWNEQKAVSTPAKWTWTRA